VLILMFYALAATGFFFTPDGTYLALQWVSGIAHGEGFRGYTMMAGLGSPSPFWVAVVSVGAAMHLDPVLLAKILSLFFSCILVLLAYLAGHDLTGDPLMALGVALVTASSGLLLQTAPSGAPHTLLAVLILGALFSMMRHDRILASVALGLACLTAWQAAILAVPLLADIWLTAGSRPRALRLLTASYVVLTALVAPWIIYAVRNRVPWLIELPPSGLLLAATPWGWAVLAVLGTGCAAAAELIIRTFTDPLGRRHLLILIWTLWLVLCALVWDAGFLLPALPVAASYAMVSLLRLNTRVRAGAWSPGAVLALTALLLLLSQVDAALGRRPAMAAAGKAVPALTELAFRVRGAVPEGASLAAEWPGLVGYVAARPVSPLDAHGGAETDFAVTSDRQLAGYAILYSAVNTGEPGMPARFLIWKRL
jgi:hypothetical protein